MPAPTKDVYISCSPVDETWVHDVLKPQLENAGLTVMTADDFEIGVPQLVNLERVVDGTRHTLIVLTPEWLDSAWNEFEGLITGSIDPSGRTRKLIPLVLRKCSPPRRIQHLTSADFTDPERHSREINRLVEALRPRIFLSYKRDISPDQNVSLAIHEALKSRYKVFIDREMAVGADWKQRIKHELSNSDYLIVLLSKESIHSEMVLTEISLAHELGQSSGSRPVILPVRLAFWEPFKYPLNEYLAPLNWAKWENDGDTPSLIDELVHAISGELLSIGASGGQDLLQEQSTSGMQAPTPYAQLERPEGTMVPDSEFYIEREADQQVLREIHRPGVTIAIKGPRQIGKSSLLMRIIREAETQGKQTVFLDFQLFDKSSFANANTFYQQFCAWLSFELDIEDQTEKYWRIPLGNNQRCTRYFSRHLLPALGKPLLLAMDEVETLFEADFRSDFFGMLRAWHNSRKPGTVWEKLDLALITSTEPYLFIEKYQSPFNVGVVVTLEDFTPEQVRHLNRIHGPAVGPDDEKKLIALLKGHPYLTRRALYLIASGNSSPADLFAKATEDRGPFGDHLRSHLFRIYDYEDLVSGFHQVIHHNTCDEQIFVRLRGAGLVRREEGKSVPRNKLYADYFHDKLHV